MGKPGLGTTTKTNVLTLLQFGNIFDLKITMDTDYNRYWINQDLSWKISYIHQNVDYMSIILMFRIKVIKIEEGRWTDIHTGSQMQAIADANAKADIMKHGKKYGNLHGDSCFHKWNSAVSTTTNQTEI